MTRAFACVSSLALLAGALFGQTSDAAPKFEAADVHVSAKTPNAFMRTSPTRNGRYELKNGTLVDFIRVAYGFDPDKVLGGPNWLEMDRFDIIAKVPAETTPDVQKQMLQALLEDRFKLKTRKETKPLPAYALTVGKAPKLKEAEGTEEAGCKIDSSAPPPGPNDGRIMLSTSNANGQMTTISLGPGMVLHYICRNMTMDAFAAGMRGMMGANLGTNPVLNETGLKGAWNFDVRWSMQLIGPMMASNGDHISTTEAVEKQLGLKLETRQVPTPVIVVESANRTPSPNPPGVSDILPVIPPPTEFEVADVKPSDPGGRGGRFQMQPGGRLVSQGMALRFLVARAFNSNNSEEIAGIPSFADSARYDITAKAPASGPMAPGLDNEALAPMMRSLLVDRFKMTFHTEERPVTAYKLVAGKPKMKKADPDSRTSCKNLPAPPNAPPGSTTLACQNATMAQFADRLFNMGPGLNWPVIDATGIEGGWDFTLTFTRNFGVNFVGPGRGGDAGGPGGAAVPSAADPSGGFTIFEAIEKQLGLKLETQKRTLPVIVIDHLEQKPTEN